MSTAVARIYTDEGFVIAADGLMLASSDIKKVLDDKSRKIFSYPDAPHLAFSFVGSVQLGEFFDFTANCGRIVEKLPLDGSANLGEYGTKIAYVLHHILASLRSNDQVRFTENTNEAELGNDTFTVAWVLIDGYFRGLASQVELRFSHRKGRLVDPAVFPIQITDEFRVYGSEKVNKLFDHDPRFQKYRNFHQKLHDNEVLSIAANRAEGIIEAHGGPEGLAVDEHTCSRIGGQTQIATITPRDGFAWIIRPGS
jgi:hypothetical protein